MRTATPIHLLIYATHFEFRLPDDVLSLLRYDLAQTNHVFGVIWDVTLIGHDHPIVTALYPVDKDQIMSEELRNQIAQSRYLKGNPNTTTAPAGDKAPGK